MLSPNGLLLAVLIHLSVITFPPEEQEVTHVTHIVTARQYQLITDICSLNLSSQLFDFLDPIADITFQLLIIVLSKE